MSTPEDDVAKQQMYRVITLSIPISDESKEEFEGGLEEADIIYDMIEEALLDEFPGVGTLAINTEYGVTFDD